MATPFVGVPLDLGARVIKYLSDRLSFGTNPLALPENILYERYSFSLEGIRYLILVGPYVDHA